MKYSKCMGSHVARDIKMPRTVWVVRLCLNINYYNFHFVDFLVRSTTLKVGALEVKRCI